jgi:hypothetical protein
LPRHLQTLPCVPEFAELNSLAMTRNSDPFVPAASEALTQTGRYQSLAGREVMLNTEPLAATLAHPNCGDYKFGWLQSFQKPLKRFFGCGGADLN